MPGTDRTTAPAVRIAVVEHRPAGTDGYPAHPVLTLDGVTLHMHRADDDAVVVWVDTEDDAQLAALRVNVNDGPVFGYPRNDGSSEADFGCSRILDDGEGRDGLVGNRPHPPSAYTVIGLIDNDSGEFMVAGVLAGEHNTADSDPSSGEYGQYTRYADHVEADDADSAAELVTEGLADGDDKD